MHRKDIELWLDANGYVARPTLPHIFYKKDTEKPQKRFKLTQHGVRFETRISNGEWVRVRSGFYKHLAITAEGKLAGLTIKGM